MSKVGRVFTNKNGEKCGIIKTDDLIRGDRKIAGYLCPYNAWLRTKLCGVTAGNIIKAGLCWEIISEEEFISLPEGMRKRCEKTIKKVKKKDIPCKLVIKSPYVKIYLDYKNRLANSSNFTEVRIKNGGTEKKMWKDVTDGHRNNAAKRYMMKMFLKDLYASWRAVEGLSVREPYQEAKLGHKHND